MPNVPNGRAPGDDPLPAVLDQIDELRRNAAELLDQARQLAAAADAVIDQATALLSGPERRDVTLEEFTASGVIPLMETLRDIGDTLAAAGM